LGTGTAISESKQARIHFAPPPSLRAINTQSSTAHPCLPINEGATKTPSLPSFTVGGRAGAPLAAGGRSFGGASADTSAAAPQSHWPD